MEKQDKDYTRISVISAFIISLFVNSVSFAASISLPLPDSTSGQILVNSSGSYQKLTTESQFGFTDGFILDNENYRAFAWADTTVVPAGVAIDDVSVAYSLTPISNPNSLEYFAKIGIIPTDYQAWNTSSLSSQYSLLNTTVLIDNRFLQSSSGGTSAVIPLRQSNLLGWFISGLSPGSFGIQFQQSPESSGGSANDDTWLWAGNVTSINVTYYSSPQQSSPSQGQSFLEGDDVNFSWVGSRGGFLEYEIQVSASSDFTTSVNNWTQINNSLTLTNYFSVGRFYWRVRLTDPDNTGNNTGWAQTQYFDIRPTDPQSGCIKVDILPTEVVNAGAQWKISPVDTFRSSGYVECNLSVAEHTITFKDVSGWITPVSKNITVREAETRTTQAVYTKQPDPEITVVSPNGNEVWKKGSTYEIKWTSVGNIGPWVKIELWRNGTIERTIVNNEANDGNYLWTIPDSVSSGIALDYQIRIQSNQTQDFDISDNIFLIFDACSFSIIPNSYIHVSSGGARTFTLSVSLSNCPWNALESDPWINVVSGKSGVRDATIIYFVSENSNPIERQGTISIGNATYTIIQKGNVLNKKPKNDFDGDGKSDIAVFHPPTGNMYFSSMNRIQFSPVSSPVFVGGDFDGDKKWDIGVFDKDTARWQLNHSSTGKKDFFFGFKGTLPAVGDFDGDGKSDIAVFYPLTGQWYISNSQAGFGGASYGYIGTTPIIADYDGDQRDDLALFHEASSRWHFKSSKNGSRNTFVFGFSGVIPVPADYDGDGRADAAVYYPPTGTWYINATTAGFQTIQYGYNGTIPVVADYDGDGIDDLALFYPPASRWHLRRSNSGNVAFTFGFSGVVPVR